MLVWLLCSLPLIATDIIMILQNIAAIHNEIFFHIKICKLHNYLLQIKSLGSGFCVRDPANKHS